MPALARKTVIVFPDNFIMRKPPAPPFRLTPPQPPGPKKPRAERKAPVSLQPEQLVALLEIANADSFRNYVMILTTFWHGLRAAETCALVEADIDPGEGVIRITRGKGSNGGLQPLVAWPDNPILDERAAMLKWLAIRGQFGVKGGANPKARKRVAKRKQSSEIVSFSPDQADVDRYFDHGREILGLPGCKDVKLNFTNPPAGPEPIPDPPAAPSGPQDLAQPHSLLFPINRSSFWKLVHRYALEAGIPRRKCKTHMLKHTIAKFLIRRGVPLNEIQQWLGWRSIATADWYLMADEEELGLGVSKAIRNMPGLMQVRQGSLFP